jgi:hypothetical protein
MYLNSIKTIYDQPIANIIINGEKLKQFPLTSGMRQFKIVLECLGRAIRQEEEMKEIQIGKEVVKLSLLTDDIILYLNNPKKTPPQNP